MSKNTKTLLNLVITASLLASSLTAQAEQDPKSKGRGKIAWGIVIIVAGTSLSGLNLLFNASTDCDGHETDAEASECSQRQGRAVLSSAVGIGVSLVSGISLMKRGREERYGLTHGNQFTPDTQTLVYLDARRFFQGRAEPDPKIRLRVPLLQYEF